MSANSQLSVRGRAYVLGVIIAGTFAVTASLYELAINPIGYQWFILAALTIISGSATVKLPSIPASLSVSETFVFTSVLLYGPPAGTLTVALDGLIISLWLNKQRKEAHRVLFNMAAPALSIWLSSQVFFRIAKLQPLFQQNAGIQEFLFPLLVFTVLYFGLNSWLIAFAVALETGAAPAAIWRNNFLWLSLNFLCGASVAALLTTVSHRVVDLTYLGAILPLLFVLYMTYRTSMARVEDANKHLQQVNTLYLSTIETLAMAIDAKDQVTHGHIRRVQAYATGLAKALGVREPATLHAVEAASLLHDMGKLAIPEHILNKPGRLTPSEFEKMKLHAAIGADILSAIHFPYPVVPIVRHHHENWDGSGYPDGVTGTDIPIGARILSVVDCFDALTSDRPYRPALSDEEALKILLDRRGSMYDPLVVDTFVRVHKQISPDSTSIQPPPQVISAIAKGIAAVPSESGAAPLSTSDHSERLLIFASLLMNVPSQIGSSDLAELCWYHLRQMLPLSALSLFSYDRVADDLVCSALVGPFGPVVYRVRTPIGQGLSGWVAASRQSIVNSDPRLDFGATMPEGLQNLQSALSLPLVVDDQLIGVLTLYSDVLGTYSDAHLKALTIVSPRLAHALSQTQAFDRERNAQLWDQETGLPNHQYLREYVAAPLSKQSGMSGSLLLIQVAYRRSVPMSPVLKIVADAVRSTLRLGDFVFRLNEDEFLCILNGAEAATAQVISLRVSDAVERSLHHLSEDRTPVVRVGAATPSLDGTQFDELLATARERLSARNSELILPTGTG
jgi:putative nucleotidyltransferase with HDIG domain